LAGAVAPCPWLLLTAGAALAVLGLLLLLPCLLLAATVLLVLLVRALHPLWLGARWGLVLTARVLAGLPAPAGLKILAVRAVHSCQMTHTCWLPRDERVLMVLLAKAVLAVLAVRAVQVGQERCRPVATVLVPPAHAGRVALVVWAALSLQS
jgi:hypothetical protein